MISASTWCSVGKIDDMYDYFAREGAVCPKSVNPAEFMIDVVSGHLLSEKDWGDVWENSESNREVNEELDRIKHDFNSRHAETRLEDDHEFATTTPTQLGIVLKRASIQVGYLVEVNGMKLTFFEAVAQHGLHQEQVPPTYFLCVVQWLRECDGSRNSCSA